MEPLRVQDSDKATLNLLGSPEAGVAIREDVFLLTQGRNCVQVIKNTLDGVDRGPVPEAMRLECSLAKLLTVMIKQYETPENRHNIDAVRKVLAAADKNRDRVTLRLQGGATLRSGLPCTVRTCGLPGPSMIVCNTFPRSRRRSDLVTCPAWCADARRLEIERSGTRRSPIAPFNCGVPDPDDLILSDPGQTLAIRAKCQTGTASVWPARVRSSLPVVASQTLMFLPTAAAIRWLSGLNATQ